MGGMQPEYFDRHLRPYDVDLYLDGVDRRRRDNWEQLRAILGLFTDDPEKLPKYHWDTERIEVNKPTKEELDELFAWGDEILKKHGG